MKSGRQNGPISVRHRQLKTILVLRHIQRCPLGSIASHLLHSDLGFCYIDLFAKVPKQLPLNEAAGLIVLGGPMSVNDTDKYSFLSRELDWIREAVIEKKIPTLGVCLGSQLLAKALGAKVHPNRRKEIGWFEVNVLPAAKNDALFGGSKTTETVFQWHGETFDLPKGTVHLASSKACGHQAFRFGNHAYGVQFHIEMTPELLAEWLAEPDVESRIGKDGDPKAIKKDAAKRFPAMNAFCGRLLKGFTGLCREGVSVLNRNALPKD